MQITPPVRVQTRTIAAPPPWELAIRYGAAYSCTLIAIAAAQLRIPNSFALLLVGVTLLGLPISLYLRWSGLRIGGYRIHRPVINSTIVVLSTAAALYRFHDIVPLLSRAFTSDFYQFLLRYSTEYPFELLMQVFLLFAVFRCLAIINDNDAVLCALPSFSVLLLLIVVHKGPQVVAYFLLWSLISAVLFALDHRAEARHGVIGRLPSIMPGQDVKLSARSLATVMGFSLLCAMLLSYTLTSRDNDEKGKAESWMSSLASRLTRLAFLPDVPVNAGPERQIDFTSAPALPSRRPLWQVQAFVSPDHPLHPPYWRLFTLSRYDGSIWSQTPRTHDEEVTRSALAKSSPGLDLGSRPYPGTAPMRRFAPSGRSDPSTYYGYSVDRRGLAAGGGSPKAQARHDFGVPRVLVRQTVMARNLSFGYVPMLPEARVMRLLYYSSDVSSPERIFMRKDSSAEVGVLDRGGAAQIISAVPPGAEYMAGHGSPPLHRQQRPNPQAYLSPQERQLYLSLPNTLPPSSRVRQLALREARKVAADASDFARAQRLERFVRSVGTYTLHPPEIPVGQDATDYFLFKSKRGYCTYYAGALTVLCRAAGIPARVVSGFVNPEWDSTGTIGTIYESNAHAWTEVWVPNWGWATLDATPSDDRGNNAPNWWDTWSDLLTSLLANDWAWLQHNHLAIMLGTLCLVGLGLVMVSHRQGLGGPTLRWFFPHRGRLSDDATRQVVLSAYKRAAKLLSRRFRPRAHWETPTEWLQAAESELEIGNPEPLRHLTNLYAQAKYSVDPLPGEAIAVAQTALANLSWQRSVKPE